MDEKPFTLSMVVRDKNGNPLRRIEKSFSNAYQMWVWHNKNQSPAEMAKRRRRRKKKDREKLKHDADSHL